tara:strand:- start:333 stop:833 length:501 start_codon:yes stop_codon:yes gene_type:complete
VNEDVEVIVSQNVIVVESSETSVEVLLEGSTIVEVVPQGIQGLPGISAPEGGVLGQVLGHGPDGILQWQESVTLPGGEVGQVLVKSGPNPSDVSWDDVGVTSFTYDFTGLLSTKIIEHNLQGRVSVHMVDDTGQVVVPVITIIDENNIEVAAGETLKGTVTILKIT